VSARSIGTRMDLNICASLLAHVRADLRARAFALVAPEIMLKQ
jgi:hypothetical protein